MAARPRGPNRWRNSDTYRPSTTLPGHQFSPADRTITKVRIEQQITSSPGVHERPSSPAPARRWCRWWIKTALRSAVFVFRRNLSAQFFRSAARDSLCLRINRFLRLFTASAHRLPGRPSRPHRKSGCPIERLIGSFIFAARSNTLRMPELIERRRT